MSRITEEAVLEALKQIKDPDLRKDIVTLGFIKDLKIDGGNVSFRVVLTTPACPVKEEMETQANEVVGQLEGVESVKVTMDAEVPKGRGIANNVAIPGVKNIIAVSSGKGGVGKSTAAVNLAVGLAKIGAKVGILDADVYGPNVPLMLGCDDIFQQHLGLAHAFGVKLMSVGMLVPPDRPMVLRGPMLHGFVRDFLGNVDWGELDYLIVDMPPGTGDVQLSLAQLVPVQGAVMVTTPQNVSVADVRRALRMFEDVSVPILGIIENMSYFIPPDMPDKKYYIFGEGGGRKLAEEYNVPFLGEVPLGMEVREASDNGTPVVISNPDSPQAKAFMKVAEEVARRISIEAMKPELKIFSRAK